MNIAMITLPQISTITNIVYDVPILFYLLFWILIRYKRERKGKKYARFKGKSFKF